LSLPAELAISVARQAGARRIRYRWILHTTLIIVSVATMQTNETRYSVAIIGAGVFGAWTAYFLQRAGLRVILIDAYGPANSRASSSGESRIIRMGYGSDEIYTRWAARSLTFWKELSARAGLTLFHPTGMLWMCRENDAHMEATVETLKRVDIRFDRLDRTELERRYPQIAFGPITWAVFEPESGAIMARRAVQTLVQEARRAGIDYLQAAVTTPPGNGDNGGINSITTQSGARISADQFIFACGPWLPKIFPELLGERIFPTRQEVYFFGVPPGNLDFSSPRMPAFIDFKERLYGVPDLENRGFKIALDRRGPTFDPDCDERTLTLETMSLVRSHLDDRFPAMKGAPLIEGRVCQYENTSNADFLVDRHPHFDNLWLVGGGSGHGFKHGPALGEYVTKLLTGRGAVEPRFTILSQPAGPPLSPEAA
jgi:monomeric sarcosine oxidase